ncbi:MAG: rhomboid family intramembrane serine protease [Saprospiraceae bacterium]
MFDSIWNDIKRQFSHGNTLTRIILVNVGFFVFVNLVRLVLIMVDQAAPPPSYQPFIHFFTVSSSWKHNLTHPWGIFTHMFLHEGFWHILWNMLFLYWFGRIVGDLLGDRRVLPIYLLGGLAGGLTYFVMANISSPWAFGGYALGASAAVMAILMVAGMTAPDYIISLLFLGDVKLKYIVAVLVFLDLIALSWNSNSGGSFGHLGGVAMGFAIAHQLQRGNDLTAPVNRALQSITAFFQQLFSGQKGPKVVYKNPNAGKQWHRSRRDRKGHGASDTRDASYQEKLDAILDKIKQSGYESLSDNEKAFLFDASKK